ncbi:MAG: alanine--tRNA ligase [Acidimicrobiales bacterium]|nr:alanine--tRNA ligase [Acidimicrobiales bacterium]
MKSNEVRKAFTDFFGEREHSHQPSASLIPHDPTVLFTVAGMVPFKTYFTGEETPAYQRAVTIQKCVRAGGKHNDLDEIGRTKRHLTFFEMMGNFSFGDYFKEDACAWAWEFVTEVLGLDKDRLWVTVHLSDDEAAEIWEKQVGVSPERIQRLDEDNYWKMGDVGPCGPCSEIFWDKGPEFGADGGPAHGDEDRFIEFWNLVFMQFEQQADGSKVPLPKPSIDTGMGLERTVSILQGVDSVWDTDELFALQGAAAELTGVDPVTAPFEQLVSMRILADHARSTSMLVSDGVFPSNEARGYVLRRLLRRAVRHAYILGVETAVMGGMVDAVVETMGPDYPDLVANHEFVRDVIDREEVRFRETLRKGQAILDEQLDSLSEGEALPGDIAFLLHDTYGFPLEVTEEITQERGVEVDVDGFRSAMAEQQRQAKEARKVAVAGDTAHLTALVDEHGETDFTGRDEVWSEATMLYIDDNTIVLDRTPFYAESGGQIGDTGTITGGGSTIEVTDTRYGVPGLHIHEIAGSGGFEVGQTVTATIDGERRAAIRRNHTATHILHHALREVLGDHVKQQGSYVGPDRLRFDFSHYEGMTPDQLAAVEDLVNAEVLDNGSCRHFETTMETAEQLGAIAFFGDKYGDVVRVLEAGRNSVELCGGTHVRALGDIGQFRIVTEGSIGSNIRRVEALTGTATVARAREMESMVASAAGMLGAQSTLDLEAVAATRMAEIKQLQTELAQLKQQLAVGQAPQLAATAVDGVVVARVDNLERDSLRDLAVSIRDHADVHAVVLAGALVGGNGVALVSAVTPESPLNAGVLIDDAKKTVGGGGKASDELAVAGGKHVEKIDEALDQVRAAAGIG